MRRLLLWPTAAAMLLARAAASESEAEADAAGNSGSGDYRFDELMGKWEVEEWEILLLLGSLGLFLVLLASCVLVCGDAKAKRADAAETFREKPDQRREASRPDHSVGAVNALLGMSADDERRKGCRVPYSDCRLALQNVFAQAIWDLDVDGNQDEAARAHAVAEEWWLHGA